MSLYQRLTEEELKFHVTNKIDELERGDLYVRGLEEKDRLLAEGEALPHKKDKDHKFNKFLWIVAESIADGNSKKKYYEDLYKYADSWNELISTRAQSWPPSKAGSVDQPTRDAQKAEKNPKKRRKTDETELISDITDRTTRMDESMTNEKDESPVPSEAKPAKKRKTGKSDQLDDEPSFSSPARETTAESMDVEEPETPGGTLLPPLIKNEKYFEEERKFEAYKKEILDLLPDGYKNRFGQIGFAKWGGKHLPALIMNPFSLDPIFPIRIEWMKMFEKVKSNGRIESASNIVYYYGTPESANNFSLIPWKNFTSYDVGKGKGYLKPYQSAQKKTGNLTSMDKTRQTAMKELERDQNRPPEARRGLLSDLWYEDYQWEFVPQDETSLDAPTSPMAEPISPVAVSTSKATSKGKKKKSAKKTNADEPKSQAHVEVKTASVEEKKLQDQYDQNFLDQDLSSHDDGDDMDAEITDSDADDEDFVDPSASEKIAKEKPKKKRLLKKEKSTQEKDAPRKSITKTKAKKDSSSGPSLKKKSAKKLQAELEECEREILPLIDAWRDAQDAGNEDEIDRIIPKVSLRCERFSALFIRHYGLAELAKKAKKARKESKMRLDFFEQLKGIYITKNSQEAGVKLRLGRGLKRIEPKATQEAKDVPPSELKPEPSKTPSVVGDASVPSKPRTSLPSAPSTPVREAHECRPKTDPSKKADRGVRKTFSLGTMMAKSSTSKSNVSLSSIGADDAPTSSTATKVKSAPKQRPLWMIEKSTKQAPTDEPRAFALEFLRQAVHFVPSTLYEVDHESMALEIEHSLYEACMTLYTSVDWKAKYWERLHAVVGLLSGMRNGGPLAQLMGDGKILSIQTLIQDIFPRGSIVHPMFNGYPLNILP